MNEKRLIFLDPWDSRLVNFQSETGDIAEARCKTEYMFRVAKFCATASTFDRRIMRLLMDGEPANCSTLATKLGAHRASVFKRLRVIRAALSAE